MNSVKSHLALQYARERYGPSKETELYYTLCQQYFEEALNINSDKVLQHLINEAGMDPQEALKFFTSEENVKKLFNDIQKTKKRGVLGVPYFQISLVGFNDNNPLLIGGQDRNGFTEIFNKMLKDRQKHLKSKK